MAPGGVATPGVQAQGAGPAAGGGRGPGPRPRGLPGAPGLRLPAHPVGGAQGGQLPQGPFQGSEKQGVDLPRLLEADLRLGGVHVDVHQLRGQAQGHHPSRVAAPGQQAPIDLFEDRAQEFILHHPAVHQQDLEAVGGQGIIRVGDEAGHGQGTLGEGNREHAGGQLGPVQGRHPFFQGLGGRGGQKGPGVF